MPRILLRGRFLLYLFAVSLSVKHQVLLQLLSQQGLDAATELEGFSEISRQLPHIIPFVYANPSSFHGCDIHIYIEKELPLLSSTLFLGEAGRLHVHKFKPVVVFSDCLLI